MKLVWDVKKAAASKQKHGVDFDVAIHFEFASALVVDDDRMDYGEVRQVAIGFVGDRMHVMVFTDRGEERRVISFRKANRREIERYEQDI